MSESHSDLEELVRAYAAALAQEMQAKLHKHLIAEALRHGFELPPEPLKRQEDSE